MLQVTCWLVLCLQAQALPHHHGSRNLPNTQHDEDYDDENVSFLQNTAALPQDAAPPAPRTITWQNNFNSLPDTVATSPLDQKHAEAEQGSFNIDDDVLNAVHSSDSLASKEAFGFGSDDLVEHDAGDPSEMFPHMDLSKYKNSKYWQGAIDSMESDDPFFTHKNTPEENPNLANKSHTRTMEEITADRMQMALCRIIEQSQFDLSQECSMCMRVVGAVIKQTWICACYRNPMDMSNYNKCVDMKRQLDKDRGKIVVYLHEHRLDPRISDGRVCDEWGYCPGHGSP